MLKKEEIEEIRKKFEEKQQTQKQQWDRWALENGVDIIKNDRRRNMSFSDLYELKMEKKDITVLHFDGRKPETFKGAYTFGLVSKIENERYGELHTRKIKTKPKVYAWDISAKKEQKKLEQEQQEVEQLKLLLQYFENIIPKRCDGKSLTHLEQYLLIKDLFNKYGLTSEITISWLKAII